MAKVRIADVTYDVPENLTLGEQVDISRELGDGGMSPLGVAAGLAWIAVRRVMPKTKMADLAAFEVEWFDDDDDDAVPPTNGSAADTPVGDDPTAAAQTNTGTQPYGSTAGPSQAI